MIDIPTDIVIDRTNKTMRITWGDQVTSEFSFAYLRAHCPCAYCDTTKHGGEPTIKSPEEFSAIEFRNVEEVGRYALRFTWSDGHDLGIYSFSYLREKSGISTQ